MIKMHHRVVWAVALASGSVASCAKDSMSERTFAASDFPQPGAVGTGEGHPSVASLQDRLEAYEAQMSDLGIGEDAPVVAARGDVATRDIQAAEFDSSLDEDTASVAESVQPSRESRSRRPRAKQRSAAPRGASPPAAAPSSVPSADAEEGASLTAEDELDEEASTICTNICALADAVCGLEARICSLADEHSDEADYRALCARAGQDCERASVACGACSDPQAQ